MPLRGSSEPNSRTTVLACYATCNHTHGEDVGLSGSRSNKQTPWLKAWTKSSMTSHSVIYVRFSRLLFLQQQQQQREALSVRPTGTKTGSEWKKKDGATGRRENESIHHGPRRWHLCSLWRDAMNFNMKLWWGGKKRGLFLLSQQIWWSHDPSCLIWQFRAMQKGELSGNGSRFDGGHQERQVSTKINIYSKIRV